MTVPSRGCCSINAKGSPSPCGQYREINPGAALVQTEDLGRTFSTTAMRYQAEFDNERRWLTWDLLLGMLQPRRRLWEHFAGLGIPLRDLHFFAEHPSRIDIIGINHYVTSDRYLDENIDLYPAELHGSNGRQIYADDAAVRSRSITCAGFRTAIAEAHQRYGLPIALTEVHLGCDVHEQMRWFYDAWQSAETMRGRGVDMRAVTAWALFGSFDWDSLVTHPLGNYEPGPYELRRDAVIRTPLAEMLSTLARTGRFDSPILQETGWWRRRSRLREFVRKELAA